MFSLRIRIKKTDYNSSVLVQWVKDPALLLQQLGLLAQELPHNSSAGRKKKKKMQTIIRNGI